MSEVKRNEALRGLRALRIEVPADVADDVTDRVIEYVNALEAENRDLRVQLESISEALNSGDGSYHP